MRRISILDKTLEIMKRLIRFLDKRKDEIAAIASQFSNFSRYFRSIYATLL